jgi:hypothetical protein
MSVVGCTLCAMNPTIDQIIEVYFADRRHDASGVERRRSVVVERALRDCLEESGPAVLTAEGLEIVNLERSLDPREVFVRTMHADALIVVLPLFVSEPYLLRHRLEVLEQLHTAIGIRHMVVSSGLIDAREFCSPIFDLEFALVAARNRTQPMGS